MTSVRACPAQPDKTSRVLADPVELAFTAHEQFHELALFAVEFVESAQGKAAFNGCVSGGN